MKRMITLFLTMLMLISVSVHAADSAGLGESQTEECKNIVDATSGDTADSNSDDAEVDAGSGAREVQ